MFAHPAPQYAVMRDVAVFDDRDCVAYRLHHPVAHAYTLAFAQVLAERAGHEDTDSGLYIRPLTPAAEAFMAAETRRRCEHLFGTQPLPEITDDELPF